MRHGHAVVSGPLPPAAILAGGLATRLGGLVADTPKALLEVAGRPFVFHQLDWLRRGGVREVVLCVGHLGRQIEQAVGDGSPTGVSVRYSDDGAALAGTGGALRRALPLLGAEFFVLYGDSWLSCSLPDVCQAYRASGKLGLMTIFRNDGQWDTSNVRFADDRMLGYDKRHRTADMHHIDYGLGVLSAQAFAGVPDGTHVDLATIYQDLLQRDELAGFEVSERFYEIGSPAGLDETRRHFEGRAVG
ncbi:MAG: NTP transferase domain-containing protein [Candidatus Eremiobacteraeota bacterium]|nr:NTP transferase domain-containing protein [Candidatus Eremiobacteraeota bacterium]